MTVPDGLAIDAGGINHVGVVGYGYVGRGTAHALSEVADVSFHDPAVAGSLDLTELVARSDALFVCVPTPMGTSGAADLTIVFELMEKLSKIAADTPIILKSTVPPGTSAVLVRQWPSLPLAFNPEFLRERHSIEDSTSPSRVVLGWTSSIDLTARSGILDLYTRAFPCAPLIEMDATEAELLKYASNALFGVKVSFANEMEELARSLGVTWEPVRRALILDPRVGDGHLTVPGPDGQRGFGGSCLPKDIAGLLSLASTVGVELPVIAAAVQANSRRRVG
jgi:UDPglucose 6-dehydrogenase